MTVETGAGMHNGLENTIIGTQTTAKGRRSRSRKETMAVPH
jgi:hypothetical protein